MILEEMIEELRPQLRGRSLINVCVGYAFTASMIDTGQVGIAHTIAEGRIKGVGSLIGKSILEVVSDNFEEPLQRSLSVSILNAFNSTNNFREGRVEDMLDQGRTCVFGYSPPLPNSKDYVIYDFYDKENHAERRKSFSSFTGERCMNVIIYGSALVNGYIDKILSLTSAENVALAGVSSVDSPHVLKSHGINFIGISKPVDNKRAMRMVCEGGREELGPMMRWYFKRI